MLDARKEDFALLENASKIFAFCLEVSYFCEEA